MHNRQDLIVVPLLSSTAAIFLILNGGEKMHKLLDDRFPNLVVENLSVFFALTHQHSTIQDRGSLKEHG